MVVSLNYCSQNGGNVYRAPYYNRNLNIGPRIIGNLDQYPYGAYVGISLGLIGTQDFPKLTRDTIWSPRNKDCNTLESSNLELDMDPLKKKSREHFGLRNSEWTSPC